MPPVVLGLDIGGANLKAATADKRAVSVPFPLWREPDSLPAKLAELAARFPDADEFAVTMTGELCDCYETKRQGVNAILTAVQNVSRSRPIRVWGTDGQFLNVEEVRRDYLKVAAANWHALATFAGAYVPYGTSLLIDVGSTTTDLIPILDGQPWTEGRTDAERMRAGELVYTGYRRTPVCALMSPGEWAAELFATTLDVYLLLGHAPESESDTDTADGRPATKAHAHARLSRMLGGDPQTVPEADTLRLAEQVAERQQSHVRGRVESQVQRVISLQPSSLGTRRDAIVAGSGEFLAWRALEPGRRYFGDFISLNDRLGPAVSACAPAYALAVLGTERRP
jgi:probable H4MPT-linked C1 transfer pathway protein